MIKGVVVRVCDQKTAQVNIVEIVQHPLYKKVVKRNKKIACQYDNVILDCGDKVLIRDCKPYSKTKKHIVVEKVVL